MSYRKSGNTARTTPPGLLFSKIRILVAELRFQQQCLISFRMRGYQMKLVSPAAFRRETTSAVLYWNEENAIEHGTCRAEHKVHNLGHVGYSFSSECFNPHLEKPMYHTMNSLLGRRLHSSPCTLLTRKAFFHSFAEENAHRSRRGL